MDLFMIAQLDGVRTGLGRELLGSLTGPVLSLIQHHGPTALLGVEGALLPAVQMGTLGLRGLRRCRYSIHVFFSVSLLFFETNLLHPAGF